MKLFTTCVTTLFLFVSTLLFAQKTQLAALLIPEELREDANAVIRNESETITISSVDKMTVRVSRTITILNKIGDNFVGGSVWYNNDTKIKSLNAEIYDAFGTRIKKVKKKEFFDFSAVDGGTLYSDARVKELQYTPTKYPYTVKLEYEYETSTTSSVPDWSPVYYYYVGVQNSMYTINYPADLSISTKEKFFDGFNIENYSSPGLLKYSAKNIKPIMYEASGPSLNYVRPMLLVSPDKANTKGVIGSYKNWKEFGLWMHSKILKGKDALDETTKSKIKSLVAGVEDPIEKAKLIYEYMQNKTRYISVQVGIGGIQPIAANQVDKVGYGDCKGLTNYTKALLDLVGVPSYYVHVEAGSRDKVSFEKDFASLAQGNHVILNIPNGDEDVWLECTSQTKPFGFLGDFTDDRDVLVITPEGGVIKRTPSYLNETNLQHIKADIELDTEGNINATVEMSSKGIKYDNRFEIESFSKEDLNRHYQTNFWDYNNNLKIKNVEISNNRDAVVLVEKIAVNIEDYASLQQGAYLFRVNVFDRKNYVPKRYRKRTYPLEISRGYKDVDEFTITLPKGYVLEATPADIVLDNKFGTYKVNFTKVDESTIIYKRELLIKAGNYPKEDYKPYRSFRKKIAKYDGLRLSLINKT